MAIDPSIGKQAAQGVDATKKSLDARDVTKDVSGVAKEDAISKFNEMIKPQNPAMHSKDIPSHKVNIPDSPLQKGAHKLDSMPEHMQVLEKSAMEQSSSKHGMLGSIVDASLGVKQQYHASESRIMEIMNKIDGDPSSPLNQRMVLEMQNEMNVKASLVGLASSVLKGVKDALQSLLRSQ